MHHAAVCRAPDRMAKMGAKWLNLQGIHVMAMSPDKKDYGHHNYPLERFGKAITFMKVCVPTVHAENDAAGGLRAT